MILLHLAFSFHWLLVTFYCLLAKKYYHLIKFVTQKESKTRIYKKNKKKTTEKKQQHLTESG